MLSERQQETLRRLFYGEDGSFFLQDIDKLKKRLDKKGIDIDPREVRDWYENQEVVQLLRPPPREVGRYFPIIAWRPFERFYMDTMFIPNYRLVLVVGLDLFSRYGFVYPFFRDDGAISSGRALEALQDFERQALELGYKISSVWTDDGSEFKGSFKSYLKDNDIEQVVSAPSDPRKNRNIERFNKTIRMLIEKYAETFGKPFNKKIIGRLVEAYNNEAHSSLEDRTPLSVLTDMDEARQLWKYYVNLKHSVRDALDEDDVLPEGTWVRWFVRLDSPFKKIARNWSKALYQVEGYDKRKKLYKLDGLDKMLRRDYLQVVNKEMFDKYNFKPQKTIMNRDEDRLKRKIRITRDIRDVISQPVLTGKRERKQREILNL